MGPRFDPWSETEDPSSCTAKQTDVCKLKKKILPESNTDHHSTAIAWAWAFMSGLVCCLSIFNAFLAMPLSSFNLSSPSSQSYLFLWNPPLASQRIPRKGNASCLSLILLCCATFHVPFVHVAAAAAKSLQSCSTLRDPIDGSPPGSPVPGILQARTLEWVVISLSNTWKWKVKVKSLSHVWLLATPWTAAYQAPPSMGFSRQEYWSGVPLCCCCVSNRPGRSSPRASSLPFLPPGSLFLHVSMAVSLTFFRRLYKNHPPGTSLVVQWLRIHLPRQ